MGDIEKVAIVICPPWDINMPSLGIGYLCAYLKSSGITSKVFDLNIELYHKSKNKFKWDMTSLYCWEDDLAIQSTIDENEASIQGFLKELFPFKIICFSINVANIAFSIRMIEKIRKANKNSIICAGGPITDHVIPKELRECVDYLIIGEAEAKLVTLVKKINKSENKNNKTVNSALTNNLDLDSLPWPTYEEFNLSSYLKRELPLSGSRGCYGKCNFCTDWKRRPYAARKAVSIFEEVSYHYIKNKIRRFRFNDLIINGNVTELEKFCDLVIKNRLNILWWSTALINIGVTRNLYIKMKKAGCYYLEYGIESFSPGVLKLMNKPFRYEHIYPVLKNTFDARIRAGANLLVGFPGETEEQFKENCINFRKHYKLIERVANLNPVYIYGNSNINLEKKDYEIIPDNEYLKWNTSDMKNTYEIRIKRLLKIIELLKELKIPYPEIHIKEVRDDLCSIYGSNVFENKIGSNDYNRNIYDEMSPAQLFFDSWNINGPLSTLRFAFRYVRNLKFLRYYANIIRK